MRFQELDLAGVYRVDAQPAVDCRGYFARLHCDQEFAANGIEVRLVQTSLSHTRNRGTVRGMHFQSLPSRESKLVRCLRGGIYDVVIDLRPESPTYVQHVGLELSASNGRGLFIPSGCAHGFQTLSDDVDVLYQMSDFYEPALSAGVRWDDPAFGIVWPLAAAMLHERDAAYPDFDAERFAVEHRARSESRSD